MTATLVVCAVLGVGRYLAYRASRRERLEKELAKEGSCLATFDYWKQAGFSDEEQTERLRDMASEGRLPEYVPDAAVSQPAKVLEMIRTYAAAR